MFATRDQENFVHGRQAAAASKPLNQGMRQLPPKTPGNKVPKTPFKLPLNDENGDGGIGAGKTGFKANGTSKNAFVTPLGKIGIQDSQSSLADTQSQAPKSERH